MNYKKRRFAHYRKHRSCLYINETIWKFVHIAGEGCRELCPRDLFFYSTPLRVGALSVTTLDLIS